MNIISTKVMNGSSRTAKALRELRGGATQRLEPIESRPGTELWKHGEWLISLLYEAAVAHVYTATANPRYRVFLWNVVALLLSVAMSNGLLENTRWMVSAQAELSSESGTAEGRITRRLFDETAGYLVLLPAVGWAKEQPYGMHIASENQNHFRV